MSEAQSGALGKLKRTFKMCNLGRLLTGDHCERFLDRKLMFFFVCVKLDIYLN